MIRNSGIILGVFQGMPGGFASTPGYVGVLLDCWYITVDWCWNQRERMTTCWRLLFDLHLKSYIQHFLPIKSSLPAIWCKYEGTSLLWTWLWKYLCRDRRFRVWRNVDTPTRIQEARLSYSKDGTGSMSSWFWYACPVRFNGTSISSSCRFVWHDNPGIFGLMVPNYPQVSPVNRAYQWPSIGGVHHKHQPLHAKINPKDCQGLSLGDSGFLLFFFWVVSSDEMGKPRLVGWVLCLRTCGNFVINKLVGKVPLAAGGVDLSKPLPVSWEDDPFGGILDWNIY